MYTVQCGVYKGFVYIIPNCLTNDLTYYGFWKGSIFDLSVVLYLLPMFIQYTLPDIYAHVHSLE